MKIGNFDTEKKVLIIAEIGNNHEGDFELAKEMIDAAAEAGADAVKFQTFRTEHYINKLEQQRFSRLKRFELDFFQFEMLSKLAKEHGLFFISTPFDLGSAKALSNFVDVLKISSSDNNFFPLIEKITEYKLPVILSTGLLDLTGIQKTVGIFEKAWSRDFVEKNLALLHCVCSYPVPIKEANLLAIKSLQEEYTFSIGYSDHVIGNDAAIISVALGARVVEKHFTLDHNLSDFHDHKISANIPEMKDLVSRIRNAEALLGDGLKKAETCETKIVDLVRRSIVVNRDMVAGECVKLEDLTWVRPAGGIPPGNEDLIVGKFLKKDLSSGDQINELDMEITS